jgi:hypothetical protein
MHLVLYGPHPADCRIVEDRRLILQFEARQIWTGVPLSLDVDVTSEENPPGLPSSPIFAEPFTRIHCQAFIDGLAGLSLFIAVRAALTYR